MYHLDREEWERRDALHKFICGDRESVNGYRKENGKIQLTDSELEQKGKEFKATKDRLTEEIKKGSDILGHIGCNFALCTIDPNGLHQVITYAPTIDDPQILAKQEEFRNKETFIHWMPPSGKRPKLDPEFESFLHADKAASLSPAR